MVTIAGLNPPDDGDAPVADVRAGRSAREEGEATGTDRRRSLFRAATGMDGRMNGRVNQRPRHRARRRASRRAMRCGRRVGGRRAPYADGREQPPARQVRLVRVARLRSLPPFAPSARRPRPGGGIPNGPGRGKRRRDGKRRVAPGGRRSARPGRRRAIEDCYRRPAGRSFVCITHKRMESRANLGLFHLIEITGTGCRRWAPEPPRTAPATARIRDRAWRTHRAVQPRRRIRPTSEKAEPEIYLWTSAVSFKEVHPLGIPLQAATRGGASASRTALGCRSKEKPFRPPIRFGRSVTNRLGTRSTAARPATPSPAAPVDGWSNGRGGGRGQEGVAGIRAQAPAESAAVAPLSRIRRRRRAGRRCAWHRSATRVVRRLDAERPDFRVGRHLAAILT